MNAKMEHQARCLADAPAYRGGAWNADGTILFASTPTGPLFRVSASGGSVTAITKLDSPRHVSHRFPHFLPDGRHFVFFAQGAQSGLYVTSLDSVETKYLGPADTSAEYTQSGVLVYLRQRSLVAQPFDAKRGEWMGEPVTIADSISSNESGRMEVYVKPFPGPASDTQVSTNGGISPRWSADGKELFYIAQDGKLMSVRAVTNGGGFEAGTPAALFQTRIFGGGTYGNKQQYAVARDGRFLINVPLEEGNATPITIIQNWRGKPN